MRELEVVTDALRGQYRDVLFSSDGRVIYETGWNKNAIVGDCRRLLAGFMRGAPTNALGIQGLQVGMGNAAWDVVPPGTPPPTPGQVALVDPNPHTVPRAQLVFSYLNGAVVSPTPTNRLQIVATLGPGIPAWPDANHATSTLREFGLVGDLDGATVLLNYVTHAAIPKDPFSTLERTIWLIF